MSLSRTAYAVCKPPPGAQKRKVAVFRINVHFTGRKSAIKFLCAKTVSGNVVTCKAFTGLSNLAQIMVGGDVSLNVNFVPKVKHPLVREQHHRFGNPAMPL